MLRQHELSPELLNFAAWSTPCSSLARPRPPRAAILELVPHDAGVADKAARRRASSTLMLHFGLGWQAESVARVAGTGDA